MAIASIGAVNTAAATAASTQQLGIGQEDFLKILLTQLTYQDPLKPLDNQQFIAQMAQFTSLEQTRQMNDSINSLLTVQSATQSIGLLGKTVGVQTASGPESVGTVMSLTFENGSPNLTIKTTGGQLLTGVSLSQIHVIQSL